MNAKEIKNVIITRKRDKKKKKNGVHNHVADARQVIFSLVNMREYVIQNDRRTRDTNIAIPFAYALPNKTKETWVRILSKVNELLLEASPATVLTRFESCMISAIRQQYPNSSNRGCLFHFTKCICSKIQGDRLKRRY